jgi:hypothetical protein
MNNLRLNENKPTIYDLNIDCLQEVIKKLSINEILRLEFVDKRFQYCVKEVLKQQKVLSFGKIFCKHSAINSQINQCVVDMNCDQFKAILKMFPNIKCLQIKGIEINKSLIEWISNNCKQLVCIHLYRPKSKSKSPQIEFKEIGKLLSDKIEIEITFDKRYDIKEDSIIALMQNMPQIKDINFCGNINEISIRKLIPYFGHNIRSLYIRAIDDFHIEDLNAIKNNNLFELRLDSRVVISQQIFDFICDNFTQLKSFGIYYTQSISLSKLIQLINLENFHFMTHEYYWNTIDICSIDQNLCFNQLLTLKLTNIPMTPTLFENLFQKFPNIEKLTLINPKVICEHQNKNQKCFKCVDKVLNCLSKLNRLKVFEIKSGYFLFVILKALLNNINEQTFKQLKELKMETQRFSKYSNLNQIFKPLIKSLTKLCERNPKQLITLEIDSFFMEFISEKKLIKGTEFNVFFDFIPKNLRILTFKDRMLYDEHNLYVLMTFGL